MRSAAHRLGSSVADCSHANQQTHCPSVGVLAGRYRSGAQLGEPLRRNLRRAPAASKPLMCRSAVAVSANIELSILLTTTASCSAHPRVGKVVSVMSPLLPCQVVDASKGAYEPHKRGRVSHQAPVENRQRSKSQMQSESSTRRPLLEPSVLRVPQEGASSRWLAGGCDKLYPH